METNYNPDDTAGKVSPARICSRAIWPPLSLIHQGPGGCSGDWLDPGLYGGSRRGWEAHQGGLLAVPLPPPLGLALCSKDGERQEPQVGLPFPPFLVPNL